MEPAVLMALASFCAAHAKNPLLTAVPKKSKIISVVAIQERTANVLGMGIVYNYLIYLNLKKFLEPIFLDILSISLSQKR
jgi:hypothetical protein